MKTGEFSNATFGENAPATHSWQLLRPWYGWSRVSHWAYYGGMFVPSGPFGHLHEYAAFNPSCAFMRRVVPTPVGPQWQLARVCF
jgi:hypothetical protein